MKKRVLIPIIVFGSICALAAIDMGVSAIVYKVYSDEKTYDFSDKEIKNFSFDLSISNVEFFKSEGSTKKVVCKETTKRPHSVTLENGTLKVEYPNKKNFFHFVSMWSPQFKVSVYVPATTYDSFTSKLSTGDVIIPAGFTFSNLEHTGSTGSFTFSSNVTNSCNITISTGDVSLSDTETKNLNANASTGHVYLSNVKVVEEAKVTTSTGRIKLNKIKSNSLDVTASTGTVSLNESLINKHAKIHTTTGDIKINESDAETLDLKASTGDITAVFLSSKTVNVDTSTGRVRISGSGNGGLCTVKTSTGDITISVKIK